MSDSAHVFTLGIEEEFQIIDPETRELRSHIQQILDDGKITLKEHVKPEMHQSVVELGTEICSDIACAREQVVQLRSELAKLAAQRGLADRFRRHASIFALDEPAHHGRRSLRHDRQRHATDCARAISYSVCMCTSEFPDREEAIHLMNQARYFLPHIYALSVNSPFWLGQNTGFKGLPA